MRTLSFLSMESYQRVMFVITRLGDKYAVVPRTRFDEVCTANICHNLRSRIDLSMQLLLEPLNGLYVQCH